MTDFLSDDWDEEMLNSAPEIAKALDVPRSEARKIIAQHGVKGNCSRCGEARSSDYMCRDGGSTVWTRVDAGGPPR